MKIFKSLKKIFAMRKKLLKILKFKNATLIDDEIFKTYNIMKDYEFI